MDPSYESRSASAGTLVDLAVQLHRDEAMREVELRERDERVAEQLGALPQERVPLVTAWLGALPDAPRRGGTALSVAGLLAVAIGLLVGYGAAMGVFYYDGSQPVNVVRVIGVFVVLQALMLVLFVVAALPGRGGLPEALRELSPGWLASIAKRWMPRETRDALERVVSRGERHQLVYSRVQKWQVLHWSQTMATAFNLAAIAGALQLIVASDLAFSWSTTLDVEPDAMHRLTSMLSLPWLWWSDAVPSLELVTQTQTFRAEAFGDALDADKALWFTRWWKFLFAAMVTYGLAPRLITYAFTQHRLNAAAKRAIELTPGIDRIEGRLQAARIRTRSETQSDEAQPQGSPDHTATLPADVEDASVLIAWAGVESPTDALAAGGGRTLDEDRQAIAQAAEQDGTVRVRVKAWEPPVLECLDFLRDLREAIGKGRAIQVQPMGGDAADQTQWRNKIATVSDPWLSVVIDTLNDTPTPEKQEGGDA